MATSTTSTARPAHSCHPLATPVCSITHLCAHLRHAPCPLAPCPSPSRVASRLPNSRHVPLPVMWLMSCLLPTCVPALSTQIVPAVHANTTQPHSCIILGTSSTFIECYYCFYLRSKTQPRAGITPSTSMRAGIYRFSDRDPDPYLRVPVPVVCHRLPKPGGPCISLWSVNDIDSPQNDPMISHVQSNKFITAQLPINVMRITVWSVNIINLT